MTPVIQLASATDLQAAFLRFAEQKAKPTRSPNGQKVWCSLDLQLCKLLR
jgi:hypothetical protein